MNRASLWVAGALCSVPFLAGTHSMPFPTFYREWTALAIGLAVVLGIEVRAGSDLRRLRVPWMAAGFAALAAVLGLQGVLGMVEFPGRNATGMLYAIWAGLIVVAGAQLRERFDERDSALLAVQIGLAAAGFLLALTGFLQVSGETVATLRMSGEGLPMMGLIGQRNHFANVVACGLGSVVWLWIGGRLRWPVALLFAAPMLAALMQCGSRSAAVYLLVLAVCAVGMPVLGYGGVLMRRGLAAGLALALAIAGFALFAADGPTVARLAESIAAPADPKRWALARYAWAIFAEHPLLGAGFGEFAWQIVQAAPRLGIGLDGVAEYHSHNLVLQLLAETGIAGAAVVLAPLAVWFLGIGFRRAGLATRWLLAIAAIQLWHALVEFPHWHADLLGLFALVLGLGWGGGVTVGISPYASGVLGRPMRLTLLAAIGAGALALAAAMADYRAIEAWQRGFERDRAAGRGLDEASLARLIELRDSAYGWRVEGALADLIALPGPEDDPRPALALTERALRGAPLAPLAERYAELLERAGRPIEAARTRQAVAVIARPSNPGR